MKCIRYGVDLRVVPALEGLLCVLDGFHLLILLPRNLMSFIGILATVFISGNVTLFLHWFGIVVTDIINKVL